MTYGTDYTCEHGEPFGECPYGCTGTNSWAPMDLGPYLRGEVVAPTPTVGLRRRDGLRLLYPGREHAVIGEMESGKTWFSAACVAAELDAANPVVYIHFEESDPSDLIGRLLALGADPVVIGKLLRFVAPQCQVSADALALLLDPAPALVVFDGVNEAMSLHGWGIRDEDGAAAFRRHLVMPCVRRGAATLACDHVVKDTERRGRNAIGSIHKGNGITGALILLENSEPFGRGQRGASHVFVTKDRPGHLRRHGRADTKVPGKTYMGTLVVDDQQLLTPDLELIFWAPRDSGEGGELDPREAARREAKQAADEHVRGVVESLLDEGHTANLNAIVARSDHGKGKTSECLDRLVLDGLLVESRIAQQRVFSRSEDPVRPVRRSGSIDPGPDRTGPAGLGSPPGPPGPPGPVGGESR